MKQKNTTGQTYPVLLLAFNRPDYLEKQLQFLVSLPHRPVFIHVDGPRPGNEKDKDASTKIRELCNRYVEKFGLQIQFESSNRGCMKGVVNGISWFFNNVSAGIILEDDCFPNPSFLRFCDEMLEKYKDNERIGQIGGTVFFPNKANGESFRFSIYPHCWGWATWHRAWKHYDVKLPTYAKDNGKIIDAKFMSAKTRSYWKKLIGETLDGVIDTWDYQWTYTFWEHDYLCVVPNENLVENIGFDTRATHTKLAFSPTAHLKTTPMKFPLKYPVSIDIDREYDIKMQSSLYEKENWQKLLEGVIKQVRRTLTSMIE